MYRLLKATSETCSRNYCWKYY